MAARRVRACQCMRPPQATSFYIFGGWAIIAIMLVDAPADVARQREAQDKFALLQGKIGRVPFPHEPQIYLSVIHSTSGQVSDDFQHEIDKVADVVEVEVEYISV